MTDPANQAFAKERAPNRRSGGRVNADLLLDFDELVRELGANARDINAGSARRRTAVSVRAAAITYQRVSSTIERAAADLSCADFGMRLAERQGGTRIFGPLGDVMRHSSTFGGALAYAVSHSHAHSPAARIWLRRDAVEDGVLVGHEVLHHRRPDEVQLIEQLLLLGHLAALGLTGGSARARRVHFRHQPVSTLREYWQRFRCDVRFGQDEDGILFLNDDLAKPIIGPDAGAYRAAVDRIDRDFDGQRPSVAVQVRGILLQRLGSEPCGKEAVAAALDLNVRTLHRRLDAGGTTFQSLKDEVRRERLLHYLRRTRMDLATISERLGFKEQSVLSRRCRIWYGAAPSKIRTSSGQ